MKKLVSLLFVGAFGLLITDFSEICAARVGNRSDAQSSQKSKKKTKAEKQAEKQRKKEEKTRKKAEKKSEKSNRRNQNLGYSYSDENDYDSRDEMRNRRAAERAGRRRQSNLGFSDLEEDSYYEGGDDVDFSDLDEDSYYDEEAAKKAKKTTKKRRKGRDKQKKTSRKREYEEDFAQDRRNSAVNSLRNRKRGNSDIDDEDSYRDAGSRRNSRRRVCTCPGCGSRDWKNEVPEDFEADDDYGQNKRGNGRNSRQSSNQDTRSTSRSKSRARNNNRRRSDSRYEAAVKNLIPLNREKVLPIFTKSDVPNFDLRRKKSRSSCQVYKLDTDNFGILRDELQKYRKYFSKKA